MTNDIIVTVLDYFIDPILSDFDIYTKFIQKMLMNKFSYISSF